jgi:hypothetical protein
MKKTIFAAFSCFIILSTMSLASYACGGNNVYHGCRSSFCTGQTCDCADLNCGGPDNGCESVGECCYVYGNVGGR